ncbi:MAG: GTPase HflX [Opitutales bacterium]|nr:GTPase HflX [Opitutales bacterium]
MHEIEKDPLKPDYAYLVGVWENGMEDDPDTLLDELGELVETIGIPIGGREVVRIREVQPRFLVGSGKAEQIRDRARALGCQIIVFDVSLAPAQQRNWEQLCEMTVIDRQEVILDIFASRARTKEAVLQVELARAEYMLPRLRGAWGHLNRQRGGGVNQRGEGEAQSELDARMTRERIAKLKLELEAVRRHREVQRKRRERVPLPTAAIVGYTNAGKSSLLNALTGAKVHAEDALFATLDPTTRQMPLAGGGKLLLTDTVGFVRRLPHRLVEAFKATLEEAVVADFLIHVLDCSSPDMERHRDTTMEVLRELGAENKTIITVLNKADLLDSPMLIQRRDGAIYTSTLTGEGLEQLRNMLAELAEATLKASELLIPHDRYDIIAMLHETGCVKSSEITDNGVQVSCNLPDRLKGLESSFGV